MEALTRQNLDKSSLLRRIWGSGPDADNQDFSQKIFQIALAFIVTFHIAYLLGKLFE
jgi:hypothetical protein